MKKQRTEVVDATFYRQISGVIHEARRFVHTTANVAMVKAYWLVGKMIVEKQGGEAKAAYGDGLIDSLAVKLTAEFGPGFRRVNLFAMRKFYLAFPKVQTLCEQLSWSHYRLLITVENEEARQYYADECKKSLWSVRELQHQIRMFAYDRVIAHQVETPSPSSAELTPAQLLRDPCVAEFLNLKENLRGKEKKVEKRILSHIEKFILERSRGRISMKQAKKDADRVKKSPDKKGMLK